MKFIQDGELEDQKICDALCKASNDYENGEIIEVRDLLMEIVNAIDDFIKQN